jgi:hypothetical protein
MKDKLFPELGTPDNFPELNNPNRGALPALSPEADNTGGRGLFSTASDTGISLLQGAIDVANVPVGLADIATGGRVGNALEGVGFRPQEAIDTLGTFLSPEQQAANQKVAEAEGFVDSLAASVQNPSTILQTIARTLPSIGAGGAIGKGIGVLSKGA